MTAKRKEVHESGSTISARRGSVNWKIGKWARDQSVAAK